MLVAMTRRNGPEIRIGGQLRYPNSSTTRTSARVFHGRGRLPHDPEKVLAKLTQSRRQIPLSRTFELRIGARGGIPPHGSELSGQILWIPRIEKDRVRRILFPVHRQV